jgi:pimeloyl-ACP methyl ester carboxylesterase
MAVSVLYPKVSLEETSGRISRWRAAEGDVVAAGQVIFEIDNDKAAVEVEAPAAGTLHGLMAEGSLVDVGAEVARIVAPGEADTGTSTRAAAEVAQVPTQAAHSVIHFAKGTRGPNPTPLARRLARDNGMVLDGMAGTGPGGRVQKKDVLARLAEGAGRPAPVAALKGGGGTTLHSAWLRRGEGMPLVLLHGFSGDLNSWRGVFAGAAVPGPILALDLPGHGQSPRGIPDDLDAVAAMVEATMAELGVGPAVLVGHSFGGATAVRIAARGEADVRGLCLFATAGLGPQIDQDFIAGVLRARSAASLKPWLRMLVHDPAVITDAFVRAVEAQRGDEGLTGAMRAFAARFMPDGTQAVSIIGDLARLRIPVRVVFGRQDRILPFAATRALPGNVALHAVDACGHMPQIESPDLSNRILGEVMRSAV